MNRVEPATAGDAVAAAAWRLAAVAAPGEAWLEAQLLVARAIGVSRIDLIARPELPLTATGLGAIASALERRLAGEPLAYIVGEREFFGLAFEVTPDVLIPRPETELLVERALELAPRRFPHREPLAIADLGTGTGCVAIALAWRLPRARVFAVDCSAAALEVAARNAARHRVQARVVPVVADMTGPLPASVDIVVANPPYLTTAQADALIRGQRHEPRLALDGGPDGLNAYRGLVPALPRLLSRPGVALLEVGLDQAAPVAALARPLGAAFTIHRDLAGIDRVVELRFD